MRGNTLRQLAVTGAIGFTAILTTIGIVVSLRHHRCGEPELLPIDGDPKALVEAIIRKHGGEEALKRRDVGIVKTVSHSTDPSIRGTSTSHEVFRCPHAWKVDMRYANPKEVVPDRQLGLFDGTYWYRKVQFRSDKRFAGPVVQVEKPIKHPLGSLNHFSIDYPNPLLLRDENVRLTLLGTRDVNGKEAVGLHVQWLPEPTGFDCEYYFDRQMGFLVLSRRVNPHSNYSMIEMEFKDYIVRDGVVIPETVEHWSGRMHCGTRKVEASFPETIDDKLLKPE